jgi:hypothetical protein
MFGGLVGDAVLPAAPDDVEAGAGQYADGVGVVVTSVAGALVEVGAPRHSSQYVDTRAILRPAWDRHARTV